MEYMTVGDLIKMLEAFDPKMKVVKQKDDEGNGYDWLCTVSDNNFVATEEIENYNFDVVMLEDIEDDDGDVGNYEQVLDLV